MPFVPVTPPPVQPPVEQPANVVNEQQQDQFQDQQQQQDNRIGELLQNQNTESDADSSADSTSVNSSNQSNIQVNNNSNRVEYGEFKIPETTINLSGYKNQHDYGVIGTVSIPIGGRARKTINQSLEIRAQRDQINFEAEYASACANIEDGGFVVTKNAETLQMLSNCGNEINRVQLVARHEPPVVKPAPVNTEAQLLREQNRELRLLVQQLMEKKDKTVNGGF